jgi:hypothetical protein
MFAWSESRLILDDVCYLRQADLFRKNGWHGLDTHLSAGDTFLTKERLRAIQYADWDKPGAAPCHKHIEATGKFVMQYPPGVGFLLAAFPPEVQVRSLYIASTTVVLLLAIISVWSAGTVLALVPAALLGCAALYFMVNPAKSSFSIAPTLAICAVLGMLTRRLIRPHREPCFATLIAAGLLIGLSVNLRLPNVLLAAGYLVLLGVLFLKSPTLRALTSGSLFAAAVVIGLTPTLAANAINTGHPFITAYSNKDLAGPQLSGVSGRFMNYLFSTQGLLLTCAVIGCLLLIAIAWQSRPAVSAGLIVGMNLAASLAFFLLHPTYTPYYAVPVAMLSLWTLLFAWLELADGNRNWSVHSDSN